MTDTNHLAQLLTRRQQLRNALMEADQQVQAGLVPALEAAGWTVQKMHALEGTEIDREFAFGRIRLVFPDTDAVFRWVEHGMPGGLPGQTRVAAPDCPTEAAPPVRPLQCTECGREAPEPDVEAGSGCYAELDEAIRCPGVFE